MHLKVPNSLTPCQQIQRLGVLLASAIGCGLLVIGLMLYTASPQTELKVKISDVLIAPELLPKIALNRQIAAHGNSSSTSKPQIWRFDTIELKYFDSRPKQWVKRTVRPDEYAALYSELQNDSSLGSKAVSAAAEGQSIELSVWLISDDKKQQHELQTVLFFPKANVYRVMLYSLKSNSERSWASFHHENLSTLLDPFTQQEGLD